MPLLDISISQPCSCFWNNTTASRSAHFQNKIVVGNERGLGLASSFSWKSLCVKQKVGKKLNVGRIEVCRNRLMIKAVATFEITSVTGKSNGVKTYENMLRMDFESVKSNSLIRKSKSSSEDSTEMAEREKLRRMRISKANKGNTPWNKGRKHSPETLQRIKERTKLAMQDPKVKMKLTNLGHAQSEETKMKIGVGVRLGWERRREKLMLQETCHYEWLDLIAESARKGLLGEEELQWDSYKVLDKQLQEEWLQSVEKRKSMLRPKGSKRAPKSAEQKRKISEAIAAKWADPDYRTRVCTSLARYHGITEGVERKPRRKPSIDGQTPQKRTPKKKYESDSPANPGAKNQTQTIRLRSKTPSYKDPLASTKLEMLKNIRAQRVAAVDQKTEAINRAKSLIAEAEKAADALEKAVQNNPIALASLMESRMLIAEAIQYLESTENEDPTRFENENGVLENPLESLTHAHEKEIETDTTVDIVNPKEVNGFHSLSSSDINGREYGFDKSILPHLVNGYVTSSCYGDSFRTDEGDHEAPYDLLSLELNTEKISDFDTNRSDPTMPGLNGSAGKPLVNGMESRSETVEGASKPVTIFKKWVRGRLVKGAEES